MYNSEIFNNNVDTKITGNNNYVNNEMDFNVNMNNNVNTQNCNSGCLTGNPQERVIHRTYVHDVPQDCFFMIEK